MEIEIISVLSKGREELVSKRGCEVIDIDPAAINCFTFDNKEVRLIGINKELYRLSLKSFKDLKKKLIRNGVTTKFDYSKKQ